MAQKVFKPSFIYTYRGSSYVNSNSPIRTGGSGTPYTTVVGFPQSAIDAIKNAGASAVIKVRYRVTDGGVVAYGAHKKTTNDRQGNIFYRYIGIQNTVGTGWREETLTNAILSGAGYSFKTALISYGYKGIVMYGASGQNYMQGYGLTNDSNSFQIIIEGDFEDKPYAPTNTTPTNGAILDPNEVITFQWKHNGTNDASRQTGYQIGYRMRNSSTWTYYPSSSSWRSSNLGQKSFPAGRFAEGDYFWIVRTRASNGQISPWSEYNAITIKQPTTAPTLIHPVDGETVYTETINFRWSSDEQSAYSIRVEDILGNTLFEQSRSSSDQSVMVTDVFLSGETYTWYLSVYDSYGNESEVVSATFSTLFAKPTQPFIVSVTTTDGTDHIITYTAPDTSTVAMSYVNIFGRPYTIDNSEEWSLLGVGTFGDNQEFINYQFASGQMMEYYVESVSTVSTFEQSPIVTFSSTFNGTYLYIKNDLTVSINLDINNERQEESDVKKEVKQFLGRKKPVPEFGIEETMELDVSCILDSQFDLDRLKFLNRSRRYLYYRDGYGRAFTCIIDSPVRVKDRLVGGYDVSFKLTEVDS